jgi:hypothetical protein
MTKNMAQPYQTHNTPVLNRKIKSIENYGRRYVTEYIDKDRKHQYNITSNPLDALTFFYNKAFFRGRNDKLSVVFMNRTIAVLQEYRSIHDIDLANLETKLALQLVNNPNDRRMVLESIRFIRNNLKDYDYNIFGWSVDAIRTNRSAEAYKELTSIYEIGDKLATLYLRDVTFVSDLGPTIRPESYIYFQPIYTWVKQVADAIGITEISDRKPPVVKEKIIARCLEASASPLLFNAGAWKTGANAFRLLIELL